ncbi:protein S100-A8 [Erinaceus europaeus]|uniref:Protein S100 n=1 Tax=Erinaceus europaeus TaxID=9365 RepID=A0A1S2ZW01_ERIEU|nr:protein S100-A8 [Erinaceus europaeus]XP_060057521.1 protein S100-A8 [Erinaceus europaeus]
MLTNLEKAINNIIDIFHKYSLKTGNYHSLYRNDLKSLMESECSMYLKEKNADTWFTELDINSDQAINFEEFLILVIKIAVAAHKASHKE